LRQSIAAPRLWGSCRRIVGNIRRHGIVQSQSWSLWLCYDLCVGNHWVLEGTVSESEKHLIFLMGRWAYPRDYLFPTFVTFGPLLIDICQKSDLEHRLRVLGNSFGRRWTLWLWWGWAFWLLWRLLFLSFRGFRSFGKMLSLHRCVNGHVSGIGLEQSVMVVGPLLPSIGPLLAIERLTGLQGTGLNNAKIRS